jgi:hypothetical protein
MGSQDNNRYFEQRQQGQQDRQNGLPPRNDQPSNTPTPYNKGYQGS